MSTTQIWQFCRMKRSRVHWWKGALNNASACPRNQPGPMSALGNSEDKAGAGHGKVQQTECEPGDAPTGRCQPPEKPQRYCGPKLAAKTGDAIGKAASSAPCTARVWHRTPQQPSPASIQLRRNTSSNTLGLHACNCKAARPETHNATHVPAQHERARDRNCPNAPRRAHNQAYS